MYLLKQVKLQKVQLQIIVKIGPFAHIRPKCDIANNCKVGSFAETKMLL